MGPNKADYIHSTAHCKLEIMEKQPDLYVGENRRFFTNSSRVCMDFIFSDMSDPKASKSETVSVESAEKHEPIPGTQIVTHDTVFPLA